MKTTTTCEIFSGNNAFQQNVQNLLDEPGTRFVQIAEETPTGRKLTTYERASEGNEFVMPDA